MLVKIQRQQIRIYGLGDIGHIHFIKSFYAVGVQFVRLFLVYFIFFTLHNYAQLEQILLSRHKALVVVNSSVLVCEYGMPGMFEYLLIHAESNIIMEIVRNKSGDISGYIALNFSTYIQPPTVYVNNTCCVIIIYLKVQCKLKGPSICICRVSQYRRQRQSCHISCLLISRLIWKRGSMNRFALSTGLMSRKTRMSSKCGRQAGGSLEES